MPRVSMRQLLDEAAGEGYLEPERTTRREPVATPRRDLDQAGHATGSQLRSLEEMRVGYAAAA
jgi:hypothetical protein